VSFAGTQLVVQLGRGTDYAWSATSASNDLVDIVAERLCTTNGSKPTIRSTHYRTRGPCVAMNRHVHTEDTTPNATAPGPAQHYEFLVLRTRHGIVQTRTTVNGRPVAIVLQRSTYRHEVDSLAGFARFNNPRRVKNATDFQRAANAIDYTFNWFYTDDRDIAHYSSVDCRCGRSWVRSSRTSYPRASTTTRAWVVAQPGTGSPGTATSTRTCASCSVTS